MSTTQPILEVEHLSKEFELNGLSMVDMFASRGATQAQWLTNRNFRTPDILFENEAKLDLGGVSGAIKPPLQLLLFSPPAAHGVNAAARGASARQ